MPILSLAAFVFVESFHNFVVFGLVDLSESCLLGWLSSILKGYEGVPGVRLAKFKSAKFLRIESYLKNYKSARI